MNLLNRKKSVLLVLMIVAAMIVLILITIEIHNFSLTYREKNEIQHIEILTGWGSYSEKNIAMSDIIKNYSKTYPDMSISNTSLTGEKFYTKLAADFTAGCAADIIIAPPSYDIMRLCERGYIADLSKEIATDSTLSNSLDREMLKFVSDEKSHVYGIPTDVQYVLLYCNKELFSKYNISIPRKYSDFTTAITKFASAGITPIAFGANDPNIYLEQLTTSNFEGEPMTDKKTGNIPPQYSRALREMCSLKDMGAFPSGYGHMTSDDAKRMFLDNEAAMIVETNNFINDITRNIGSSTTDYTKYTQKFEIIAFPYDSRSQNSVVFSTVAYNAGEYTIFINKKSYETNYDQIINFVKYLIEGDTLRLYLAQTNDIMTVKDIENKEYKMPLVAKCKMAVGNATKFTRMPIDITYRYVWISSLQKRLPEILDKELSIQEAVKNLSDMSAEINTEVDNQ